MRDAAIYEMHQAGAVRSALLFNQFEFLMTRQQAYEAVTSSRWLMLRAFLSPKWLKRTLDATQARLIQQSREKMREIQAKPKLAVPAGVISGK